METNFSKSHEEMQLEKIRLTDKALPTAKVDCVISDLADQLTTLNEKYANCVRQLTEAHARIDRFEAEPKGWWHKEVEELKQQLTAALAACEAKDELIRMCAGIQVGYLKEALAIQPNDSALKAWLGEPVMYLDKDGCTILPEDMEGNPRAHWQSLYAPKGMK